MSELLENYLQIAKDVKTLSSGKCRLLPVSKTFPINDIKELYDNLQIKEFAENKLQELETKVASLPKDISWHFIGKLQSNKIRKIVKYAKVIHSVETASLVTKIENIAIEEDLTPQFLVEVNISLEASKSGAKIEELANIFEAIKLCKKSKCIGLMTMAPFEATAEELENYFSKLRYLRDELSEKYNLELPELSMGMSQDYPIAIKCQSTIVRVGTLIFGRREYLKSN